MSSIAFARDDQLMRTFIFASDLEFALVVRATDSRCAEADIGDKRLGRLGIVHDDRQSLRLHVRFVRLVRQHQSRHVGLAGANLDEHRNRFHLVTTFLLGQRFEFAYRAVVEGCLTVRLAAPLKTDRSAAQSHQSVFHRFVVGGHHIDDHVFEPPQREIDSAVAIAEDVGYAPGQTAAFGLGYDEVTANGQRLFVFAAPRTAGGRGFPCRDALRGDLMAPGKANEAQAGFGQGLLGAD